MKVYEPQNIRNLAVFGHAGSGKTTLTESILLNTGAINRKGAVEEHNTVSDFNQLEHERSCSIYNSVLFTESKNTKINIIDTPGFNDYIGEVISASRVSDIGLIIVNAQNGLEIGVENAWEYLTENNKTIMFAINKLDVEQADFDNCVSQLQDVYGSAVTVFQFPVESGAAFKKVVDVLQMCVYDYSGGDKPEKQDIPADLKDRAEEIRNELIESIAETNEELMNKYFEEGNLSDDDLNIGLKKALANREVFPVFCTNGKNNIGTPRIVEFLIDSCPSPLDMPAPKTTEGNEIATDPAAKTSLFAFKISSEAQTGDITYFRMMSGSLKPGNDLINERNSSSERMNQLFVMLGKKRIEVDELKAGDIGATVKLKTTSINDTLHEKGDDIEFAKLKYPNPIVRVAVVPQTKGEEEKVGMGLHSIASEDPALSVEHSQELRQIILYGQGELHLSAAKWRLENRYKVAAEFIAPRVPYRETIQKQVRGSYRHKKQSGGAGQFAEVHMLIEPYFDGAPDPTGVTIRGREKFDLEWGGNLEFVNCIVGGVIDQRFMPAILKGVMEKMQFGPLTGSYVRDVRVAVYDGKMHPVDSNEAAFKMAGSQVFKSNFRQADPKLLEPLYDVTIKVPEEFVGDVMSDLPTRRGVILGIDSEGRYQKIQAKMPLAELDKYYTALRSMTQGRATYAQAFDEYQTVPAQIQMELIEAYKKSQEED